VLLCHGSPRKVNEFLWESTTATQFLNSLVDKEQVDVVAATHTGIKWHRRLNDDRHFVNVGVLGRPENDGQTNVWYAVLEHSSGSGFEVEFVPVEYDHARLAREMREERLPPEFVETISAGWWTSCLEVLPSRERKCGCY